MNVKQCTGEVLTRSQESRESLIVGGKGLTSWEVRRKDSFWCNMEESG